MEANDAREKLEQEVKQVNAQVAALRKKLKSDGVDPYLMVQAFFFEGVALSGVVLNIEDKLRVCDMLQTYISDTKELIVECRN